MDPVDVRALLLALASSLALAASVGVAAAQEPAETDPATAAAADAETGPQPVAVAAASPERVRALRRKIRKHRARTWHWQRVMGTRRTPTAYAERRTRSLARLIRIRNAWRAHANRAVRRAERVPHRAAWRCIHRHEGSWDDPNAPYYGGLQMDLTFQQTYGRYLLRKKGTADRWRPREQMWTAEKARRSGRGFYPWPNTARRCGLI